MADETKQRDHVNLDLELVAARQDTAAGFDVPDPPAGESSLLRDAASINSATPSEIAAAAAAPRRRYEAPTFSHRQRIMIETIKSFICVLFLIAIVYGSTFLFTSSMPNEDDPSEDADANLIGILHCGEPQDVMMMIRWFSFSNNVTIWIDDHHQRIVVSNKKEEVVVYDLPNRLVVVNNQTCYALNETNLLYRIIGTLWGDVQIKSTQPLILTSDMETTNPPPRNDDMVHCNETREPLPHVINITGYTQSCITPSVQDCQTVIWLQLY